MSTMASCFSIPVAAPDHPVEEDLSCLSFSPHPASDNLLAIGTSTKIIVKSCSIKVGIRNLFASSIGMLLSSCCRRRIPNPSRVFWTCWM